MSRESVRNIGLFGVGLAVVASLFVFSAIADAQTSGSSQAVATGNEDNQKPFAVEGVVSDGEGRPMPGVKISVHGGIGTLGRVGETVTDESGHYFVRFGPGWRPSPDTPWPECIGAQAAIIYAGKEGYCEKTLCRQGGLTMAGKEMDRDDSRGSGPDKLILPGSPYRVDFVLVPEVKISGKMVDKKGSPVTGQKFYANSEERMPGCSVLAGVTTDDEGFFNLGSLPTAPIWFKLRHKEGISQEKYRHGIKLKSNELEFKSAGKHEITIVYDIQAGEKASLVARVE